eukprot:7462828-Pyramimonas_sp.AAC.1
MAVFACVPPAQDSALWPHRELHRRPQWRCSHAFPPPSAAFRGLIGSSTECPMATFAWRPRSISAEPHSFRDAIWNATGGTNGCARMCSCPISAHPLHASWPHGEIHRRRCTQRRYSKLHMVGPF